MNTQKAKVSVDKFHMHSAASIVSPGVKCLYTNNRLKEADELAMMML